MYSGPGVYMGGSDVFFVLGTARHSETDQELVLMATGAEVGEHRYRALPRKMFDAPAEGGVFRYVKVKSVG